MFIKSIQSSAIDSIGRVMQRTTTYGEYKGNHIAIDNWRYKGKNILEKRFIVWNENFQKIVSKFKGSDGRFKDAGQWLDLKG